MFIQSTAVIELMFQESRIIFQGTFLLNVQLES